jgi:hypothetical protein
MEGLKFLRINPYTLATQKKAMTSYNVPWKPAIMRCFRNVILINKSWIPLHTVIRKGLVFNQSWRLIQCASYGMCLHYKAWIQASLPYQRRDYLFLTCGGWHSIFTTSAVGLFCGFMINHLRGFGNLRIRVESMSGTTYY